MKESNMETMSRVLLFVAFAVLANGCGTEELGASTAVASDEAGSAALTADTVSAAGAVASGYGRCYSADRHAKVWQAFADNDYTAWKEAMTEGDCHPRVVDLVNADNFEKFATAQKLAAEGKTAEADAIRTEIGLPKLADRGAGCGGMHQGNGKGKGKGKGMGKGAGQGHGNSY
jgi:hypothetical protein